MKLPGLPFCPDASARVTANAGPASVEWYNYWRELGDPKRIPFISIELYGAKPDGSNSYGAFVRAKEAAVANGSNTVFIPPGTWDIATTLVLDLSDFALVGLDRTTTRIRAQDGAVLTNLVHLGVTSGDKWNTRLSVRGITFDGNGTCSDSVLKSRNVGYSDIHEIRCTSGSGDGFKTDTRTSDINTLQVRNVYSDIIADTNGGNGIQTIGEKDGQFDKLFAYGNTSDGIIFRAFKFGTTLAETTTCAIGTLLARDNVGDGVVLDGTEKFTIAMILATLNFGRGVRIRSSDAGVGVAGSNAFNIGQITSRGNRLGGFIAADNAQLNGGQIGSLKIIGGAANPSTAFRLDGVAGLQIGQLWITITPGTAMLLQTGTPLGGAPSVCRNIFIGKAVLTGNGDVASSDNHGLKINDACHDIAIETLHSTNAQTIGGNYELSVSSTAERVTIHNAYLFAANNGNEYENIDRVTIDRLSLRGADPVALIHTGALVTVPGHVVLARDSGDGDLKARFPNGTTTTVAVD